MKGYNTIKLYSFPKNHKPIHLYNINVKKISKEKADFIMKNVTNGERKLWEFQNDLAGGFYKSLFESIAKADRDNREQLRKGFPEEVEAYERYVNEPGYKEDLDKRIGR